VRLARWITLGAVGLGLFMTSACASKTLTPGEGYIPVTGGKVWYRIVGTGQGTPLLVLHGGPGYPSYYLNPLAALGTDRPVVFYDQLGCGRSDQPADTSLYTVEGFVQRLGEVRKALGLDKVDIYGHSWGSMLAVSYMLTQPKGVEKLILAGPALSVPRWSHDADSLLTTLPDSIQAVIHENEAAGTTDSPAYQNAVMAFYAKYVCRMDPWSADLDSTLQGMGELVYSYMEGPSEFTITGTLKSFDVTKDLGRIHVPTLFIVGQHDEAVPSTAAYYQSLVPGAKLVVIPGASHLAMQEKPEEYNAALRSFLADPAGGE